MRADKQQYATVKKDLYRYLWQFVHNLCITVAQAEYGSEILFEEER